MTQDFTRRGLIATSAAGLTASLIPFPEWFATYGQAQAKGIKVRHGVSTAEGAAMLAKYKAAVGTMMPMAAGEPCGWTFQWYTHQIRSTTTKAAEIALLPAPQQPLATDTWNTCQAHGGRPLQYFLPWHRMYAYFLERIVAKATNDADFALPYWDYMDPPQRPIPADFRAALPNPLFRQDRNDGSNNTANVNGGQPIDQGRPAGTLSVACLAQGEYLAYGVQPGFNSAVNQNPHNVVHGLIGNSLGMGSVPWAANDPIFWMHHCNIDRLWASWNMAGRANPIAPDWADQQFVFADENCQRVLVTVKDFAAIGPLGYTYDKFAPVPPPVAAAVGAVGPRVLATSRAAAAAVAPQPIGLAGAAPVTVPLTPPAGAAALPAGLGAVPASQRVILKLTGLSAKLAPGVLYDVYLGLPAGAARAQDRFAGAITFFDAVPLDHDHAAGAHGEGPSFSFDVTRQVRRLGARGQVSVTIVPSGTPAPGSEPVVAEVVLIAG